MALPRSDSHRGGGWIEILEDDLKLYKIKNWDSLYENNRTRELKRLEWFPMPNKQDGDGYTFIMEQKDGAAIFGAWVACVQVASRCGNPAGRGVLMRDGKMPHDSQSLSRMTRIPAAIIEKMLSVCSSQDVSWFEISDIETECGISAGECGISAGECLEGKGREEKRMEGNEKNGSEGTKPKHPSLEEVKLYCAKAGIPESDAVWFWNKCEGNGWMNGGEKIKSWQHTLTAWKAAGYLPTQKAKRFEQPDKSKSKFHLPTIPQMV
jgi:hypothetical protein